ncbi:hypothetical protein [Parabacteroides merdae]|uniref:hypothetical protein n=1 Tax=Parabacteroides merdae TaxID=46503 RepID=UPI0034A2392F
MEDDKLKSLFSDFNPTLFSDFQFMKALEEKMRSVEIVKEHTAQVTKRYKYAVAIAAIVGFAVGFLFSLTLPFLSEVVSTWQLSLSDASVLNKLADNFNLISWLLVGGTASFIAVNVYEVSISLLRTKESVIR